MATALFITRAQPFHLGHIKVIKDILKRNRNIIILIGSTQSKNTRKNPFSAREREEMITRALKARRIKNYEIVRVDDIYNDQLWAARVSSVCRFDSIYSMNPWTIRCFERAGIKVRKHGFYKRDCCSGTEIRKMIAKNKEWEKLVPKQVANFIKEIDGVKRIKRLERGR